MEAPSISQTDFVQLYARLQILNMVFLGAYVMLIYDHLLTFGEEVRKIWKAALSIPKVLFLLNRYLTPVFYAWSFVGYSVIHDTTYVSTCLQIHPQNYEMTIINRELCRRIYKDVLSFALIITAICECVMILRIYALTGRNRLIAAGLGVIWLVQVVLWIITIQTTPLQILPLGLNGCAPIPNTPLEIIFWIFPMVIDTLVFIITLWGTKAAGPRSKGPISTTIERFRRDGVIYFFCIFTINAINLLFNTASEGRLDGTAAPLATLLTSTMISRLVMNLRNDPEDQAGASTIIGNLGSFIDNGEEGEFDPDAKNYSHVFERRIPLYSLYYGRK